MTDPDYMPGDEIEYRDRDGRIQQGTIKRYDRAWVKGMVGYSDTCVVTHPTYNGRKIRIGLHLIYRKVSE